MVNKRLFNKIEHLNPKTHWDTGLIHSKVYADKDSIDCGISIWDCNRKITLDLDSYSIKGADQRLRKLDKLIDHLLSVKESYVKAYEVIIDNGGFDEE